MKSERNKTVLNMLMVVAAAGLLGACEPAPGEEAPATTEEQGGKLTEKLSPEELSPDALNALNLPADGEGDVAAQATLCGKVVAPSIPVFTTSTSNTVSCTFFRNDIFTITGFRSVEGLVTRWRTWCPRRSPPPPQGRVAWAQAAGVVLVNCPW